VLNIIFYFLQGLLILYILVMFYFAILFISIINTADIEKICYDHLNFTHHSWCISTFIIIHY